MVFLYYQLLTQCIGQESTGAEYSDDILKIRQTYLVAFNQIDILDTKTWTWLSPIQVRGEPAQARYDASAGLLYGKYWMIVGGIWLETHHSTCNPLSSIALYRDF